MPLPVQAGPLSDYCGLVRNSIIKACGLKFGSILGPGEEAAVAVAINRDGSLVDFDKSSSAKDQKVLALLKALKVLPAPPAGTTLPLWLRVEASPQLEGTEVSIRDTDFAPVMANLQRRIKRHWMPPKGNASSKIMVKFGLSRNGAMDNLKLITSSGNEDCDKAALAAVNAAQPFEPLPDGSPRYVEVEFNFDYNAYNKGGGPSSSINAPRAKMIFINKVPEQKFTPAAEAELSIKHGASALDAKNYSLAIQFFQKALTLEPANEVAKQSLSKAYCSLASEESKSYPARAKEDLKKAKEAWPENPDVPANF